MILNQVWDTWIEVQEQWNALFPYFEKYFKSQYKILEHYSKSDFSTV